MNLLLLAGDIEIILVIIQSLDVCQLKHLFSLNKAAGIHNFILEKKLIMKPGFRLMIL